MAFFIIFSLFFIYVIYLNYSYFSFKHSKYKNLDESYFKFLRLFYHPLVFVKPAFLKVNLSFSTFIFSVIVENEGRKDKFLYKEHFHTFLKDFFKKYKKVTFSTGDIIQPDFFFIFDSIPTYSLFLEYFFNLYSYKKHDKNSSIHNLYSELFQSVLCRFVKHENLNKNNKYIVELFSNELIFKEFDKNAHYEFRKLINNSPLLIKKGLNDF